MALPPTSHVCPPVFLAQATQKQPSVVMTTSASQSTGSEEMKEEAALIRSRFMDAMNASFFKKKEVDGNGGNVC